MMIRVFAVAVPRQVAGASLRLPRHRHGFTVSLLQQVSVKKKKKKEEGKLNI